mgnify:CR=1 FL=1
MGKVLITVFTPAYNRSNLLPRLYKSLKLQTYQYFEWIVVDDGSVDNTREVVETFINEGILNIHFMQQHNGGKHRAINKGVSVATGELFFIVDSDDTLAEDSLELVSKYYEQIRDNKDFCGVSGMKGDFGHNKIGTDTHFDFLDCAIAESGYKYHIYGDKAEVIRTEVMREYPFPEFPNEYFCPEALIWNRISRRYKIRYFDKVIYLCEYLEGGLSSQQTKLLERNPKATMLTYKEMVENSDVTLSFRFRCAINFWRYTLLKSFKFGKYYQLQWYWIIFFPMGIIVRLLKG